MYGEIEKPRNIETAFLNVTNHSAVMLTTTNNSMLGCIWIISDFKRHLILNVLKRLHVYVFDPLNKCHSDSCGLFSQSYPLPKEEKVMLGPSLSLTMIEDLAMTENCISLTLSYTDCSGFYDLWPECNGKMTFNLKLNLYWRLHHYNYSQILTAVTNKQTHNTTSAAWLESTQDYLPNLSIVLVICH